MQQSQSTVLCQICVNPIEDSSWHLVTQYATSVTTKDKYKHGKKTRWPYDGHFNELGTQIFAKSMYRWLQSNEASMSLRN